MHIVLMIFAGAFITLAVCTVMWIGLQFIYGSPIKDSNEILELCRVIDAAQKKLKEKTSNMNWVTYKLAKRKLNKNGLERFMT